MMRLLFLIHNGCREGFCFFFFCRQNVEEPEHPNACPFKSFEAMLSHIKAQPEWIKWRNAPLEQRPSLGRSIAKHFHPDKWNEFNPTCDIDHSGAWLAANGAGNCCKKVIVLVFVLQESGQKEFRRRSLI